jgi:hypothetical protein
MYLPLSMNLKWFSPKQAQNFVDLALAKKLLIKKKDLLIPNFDYKQVVIPVGFHPSDQIIEDKKETVKEEEENIVDRIIMMIADKTNLDKEEIVKKINIVEKEKNITTEVAAILIGKESDVDVSVFYDEIEEAIFR